MAYRKLYVGTALTIFLLLAGVLAAPDGKTAVAAEREYPSREIELVVPFPPGGPADTSARIIAPKMASILGVPVIIVNKPGGGGAIGSAYVAKAKPDGYTVNAPPNPPLTIIPILQKDLPYQVTDFVPVGSYAADASVIAARPGAPFKTLEELVDHARKNPGKLNFGSAGLGTVSFFTMELLKLSYGLDIAHVPFTGAGPLRSAILGGHVHLASTGFTAFGPLIRSGDLLPLASTAARRHPAFPQIPTMAEKGFPEAALNIWMGLYVPAKTPLAAVEVLAKALAQAARDASVVGAIEKTGMQMDYRDAEGTRRLLEDEHKAVRAAAKKLGMTK